MPRAHSRTSVCVCVCARVCMCACVCVHVCMLNVCVCVVSWSIINHTHWYPFLGINPMKPIINQVNQIIGPYKTTLQ